MTNTTQSGSFTSVISPLMVAWLRHMQPLSCLFLVTPLVPEWLCVNVASVSSLDTFSIRWHNKITIRAPMIDTAHFGHHLQAYVSAHCSARSQDAQGVSSLGGAINGWWFCVCCVFLQAWSWKVSAVVMWMCERSYTVVWCSQVRERRQYCCPTCLKFSLFGNPDLHSILGLDASHRHGNKWGGVSLWLCDTMFRMLQLSWATNCLQVAIQQWREQNSFPNGNLFCRNIGGTIISDHDH